MSQDNLTPPTGDPAKAMRGARNVLLVLALVLLAGSARTLWARMAQTDDLKRQTAAQMAVHVLTTQPRQSSEAPDIGLPGSLQGEVESPVYARSNGYVLRWLKDIGSPVKKGELLAELDTPEVDQELAQARATRNQAAAKQQIAKTSHERWQGLGKIDAATPQEVDERESAYVQANADLAAADANLRRLEQLVAFKHIVAPFDGIVTRRNVDVGDLINAGNGGAERELFRVARTNTLRVLVQVPQSEAGRIKIGTEADVTLAEAPGQHYAGKVSAVASAIDPQTRSMQAEVRLPNRDGALMPGAYVTVALKAAPGKGALTVPSNTLLFSKDGIHIATVDKQSRIDLRPVQLGRDFGKTMEVLHGLTADDAVVLNPSDSFVQGQAVVARAAPAVPPAAKPAAERKP